MDRPLKLFPILLLAALLAAPLLGHAQGPRTVDDVLAILNRLINWMFTGLLVLATIFIILAGYKYLTAASDPNKIKEANRQILYAAVAIAIGLVAQGVEFIVRQLITGF